MAGTFEIVFSGLCLFTLQGDFAGPDGVDVHLVRTSETMTECTDGGEEWGKPIALHSHQPYLVIPKNPSFDCSEKSQEGCSPTDMECSLEDGYWYCNIDDRELCVVPGSPDNHRFHLASGDVADGGVPDDRNPRKSFYWLSRLKSFSDGKVVGLKDDVYAPLSRDNPNRLIVSRIRSEYGHLATGDVSRRNGASAKWAVRPSSRAPRALAEHVSLKLEDVETVKLQSCQDADSYWWEFKPTNQGITVNVTNLSAVSCEDRDLGCTVAEATGYKDRLRHYLWYYQLVEWAGNRCPTYLPAPVCPAGDCSKDRRAQIPPLLPSGREDADNTLCPPSTYP